MKTDKSQTKNKINNERKLDKILNMVEIRSLLPLSFWGRNSMSVKKEIIKLREENENVRKENEQIKKKNENTRKIKE